MSTANPLKDARTVNSYGTITAEYTTSMSVYTIIKANSMETALEIAKACPFFEICASFGVSESV